MNKDKLRRNIFFMVIFLAFFAILIFNIFRYLCSLKNDLTYERNMDSPPHSYLIDV